LAAKLTGWRLDILSESNAAAKTAEAIFNLMLIPNMTETMAQNIFQSGFGSFQSLAEATEADVMAIPGYDDPEKANRLIDESKKLIAKYQAEGVPVPSAPVKADVVKTGGDAKAQAAERLRAELAALNKEQASAAAADAAAAADPGGADANAAPEAAGPEAKSASEAAATGAATEGS
jgi:N utilization substance protein A